MTAITFEALLRQAVQKNIVIDNGRESLVWLSTEAKKLKSVTSASLIREADKSELVNYNQIISGNLYCFYYDPKHKDTLPYYDRFPCIFPVSKTNDGFYGINLHYLPYLERAKLMDALYGLQNSARVNRRKKIQFSYGILKSAAELKPFKPCFKRYLNSHVKSRFFKIPYEAWNIAAFLPTHQFEKASVSKVWDDSFRKIYKE